MVQLNLAESRTRAQSLILSGNVYCGTERVDKASEAYPPDTILTVKQKDHPFVGRGGVKLQAALDHFNLDVTNRVCLDVGASTGGFTDCLLKAGAKKVTALDVGYGQIDWSIRSDPRVTVIERTNFRHFEIAKLPDPVSIIVMDVSFISVTTLLPKVAEVFQANLESDKRFIALIKPQFEVGKGEVGKKGIVTDEAKRLQCVEKVKTVALDLGFKLKGVIPSPITGQDGNQEFLMVAEGP